MIKPSRLQASVLWEKTDANLVNYLGIHDLLMVMDEVMGQHNRTIVPFYMEKLFMAPRIRMTVKKLESSLKRIATFRHHWFQAPLQNKLIYYYHCNSSVMRVIIL